MTNVSLQDIVDAADKQFGDYVIELDENTSVTLINPLSLSPDARKTMTQLGEDEKKASDDEAEDKVLVRLTTIITLAADGGEAQAKKLFDAVSPKGWIDLRLLAQVVQGYMGETKAGEASASQS